MKTTFLLSALVVGAHAFSPSSSFTGSAVGATSNESSLSMEYIPSGMSKEQWNKIKAKEREANKGKNLGKVGITTFKSRSFADWQKSGGKNLFPVDPTKVKDPKDIPYMQRPGGAPDDSDLKKGGGLFSMFNKKKPEPEPEPEKKTNWWTLNK
ncbi:hypothetical protein FisN_6Hh154 [Fistulifera solaris]|uniref:Uncharacterized protein n=1 Tax=Fistulifera solaris TaxID=1519565 RepID=A0A1Z5JP67_FISSO|nr:hypothetical protein FisN_6Hh154 [Fistulifera solaris]|eukprot:GAX15548.1 hypothetical protein FisN_6Hh154 [Fistulifera solaris]